MDNIVIITFFFIFYLLVLKKKRRGWMYPSIFLIAIYSFSIVCLIIDMIEGNSLQLLNRQYTIPTLFFIFLCLLFFVPFTSFREDRLEEIVLPSKNVLNIISTVLIVLSFESIFFFAGGVRDVFMYGDLGAARNDRYYYGVTFVEHSIWYTISSVSASLYMFDIVLFFIYSALGEGNGVRRFLLFIGSFSETLHVLSEVGRDGIVFWLFAFMFVFLIFRPFLVKRQRSKLLKRFVVIVVIVLIPFSMISRSRFTDSVGSSYINYMGMPFKHFCYFFDFSPLPVNYGQHFPLFFEILGLPHPESIVYVNDLTSSNAFGTFFRGFLVSFGIPGTIIVGIIMASLFIRGMKISPRRFFFYKFFIYILYFQIYSQGVFYFRQYTRGGNLFIVLSFVFTLFFKYRINYNSASSVILKRQDNI